LRLQIQSFNPLLSLS